LRQFQKSVQRIPPPVTCTRKRANLCKNHCTSVTFPHFFPAFSPRFVSGFVQFFFPPINHTLNFCCILNLFFLFLEHLLSPFSLYSHKFK
jgi:hypothetical protein